jgi:hypothetical protein
MASQRNSENENYKFHQKDPIQQQNLVNLMSFVFSSPGTHVNTIIRDVLVTILKALGEIDNTYCFAPAYHQPKAKNKTKAATATA